MILTEQMVINHLGMDYKKQGNELVYQCSICMDSGKNNLKYNTEKHILECFADKSHSKAIYAQIMKANKPKPPAGAKLYEREEVAFYKYQCDCNAYLMNNNKALDYLYKHTLINPFTVDKCGIGYDVEDKRWVFPVYDILDSKLKGFEYRAADLTNKQIWKEKDTPACLSGVWGKSKAEKLYICEGFKDAYILTQWLDYNENVAIMTPSNGVGSLEKVLPTLTLANFEVINLCLDNDEAGQKVLASILEQYKLMVNNGEMIDKTPQFTDDQKKSKLKDITDLYRLKLEGNNEY